MYVIHCKFTRSKCISKTSHTHNDIGYLENENAEVVLGQPNKIIAFPFNYSSDTWHIVTNYNHIITTLVGAYQVIIHALHKVIYLSKNFCPNCSGWACSNSSYHL